MAKRKANNVVDDSVKTRIPKKGRTRQSIRNKFREIVINPYPEGIDDEELEEISCPEKINGRLSR